MFSAEVKPHIDCFTLSASHWGCARRPWKSLQLTCQVTRAASSSQKLWIEILSTDISNLILIPIIQSVYERLSSRDIGKIDLIVIFHVWARRNLTRSGLWPHKRFVKVNRMDPLGLAGSETTNYMMTSSNGNIFRVTGHLCGEFTGHRWIPHTKASDAELWCFLWSAPE